MTVITLIADDDVHEWTFHFTFLNIPGTPFPGPKNMKRKKTIGPESQRPMNTSLKGWKKTAVKRNCVWVELLWKVAENGRTPDLGVLERIIKIYDNLPQKSAKEPNRTKDTEVSVTLGPSRGCHIRERSRH